MEPSSLENYMADRQWLQKGEQVLNLSKAGEGNMNVVLRGHTTLRSFIIKQSRPYVQKYPQVAAPVERIHIEHLFYRALSQSSIKQHLPKVLGFDGDNHMLFMEDLGNCEDMTSLYAQRKISAEQLKQLVHIITEIHSAQIPMDFPDNMEMRQLNHQHIFVLPFLADNGFSLDELQPGLNALAQPIKDDAALLDTIASVGQKYLQQGNTLLHGDYYPGSWMQDGEAMYVLDPEFGFVGFPEFDLGVMAGHLLLATHDKGYVTSLTQHYGHPIDQNLIAKVAGIEMMRRLIGLAQLPLKRTLREKKELLHMAKDLITI
jgi:5-methylthioribose kinase